MTPLNQWLRRTAERWLKQFYEGPEPPARIAEVVADFSNLNLQATRADWAAFASQWAAECYRQGWQRGYENVERAEDWHPDPLPEVVADLEEPGWRESEPVELLDPWGIIPEEVTEA